MAVVGWILLGLLALILGLVLSLVIAPVRIKLECVNGWRIKVYLLGAIPVFWMSSPFEWDLEEEQPKETPKKKPAEPKKKPEEAKRPSILDDIKAFFRDEGIDGVLELFRGLTRMLTQTVSVARRAVTIRKLALCVRVGSDEADDTALNYGRISTALAVALSALSAVVRIKRPCIRVVPDFTAPSCDVKLRMILWIWPIGMIAAFAVMAFRLLCLWFQTFGKPRKTTEKQPVET